MSVKVVTDSTSDVSAEMARSLGISVVAQNVHFGAQAFKDNVTISPDQFYAMLAAGAELPHTSQASPGEFKDVYDAIGPDADGIVSIHISSKISGTWNSARLGAAEASTACPLDVIDSQHASMALGLIVIAAAQAANRGAGHDDVVTAARDAVSRAQCFCLFDSLEYLHRGGRIGKAQVLLGSILNIKPMIVVRDGEVHPLGKARTFARGLSRMKQTAREFAPFESLAVMHATSPETAGEVLDDLSDLLVEGNQAHVARFGPALGVYAGPGAIGIALLQATQP